MGVCPFVGVSRDPKCLACQGQLQCLAGLGSSGSGNLAEMRCLFSQSCGKTCSSTQTRPSITMLVLKQRCRYPDQFDHGCVVDVCIADLKSAWQTFPFGFSTFHNTTNGVISHGQVPVDCLNEPYTIYGTTIDLGQSCQATKDLVKPLFYQRNWTFRL